MKQLIAAFFILLVGWAGLQLVKSIPHASPKPARKILPVATVTPTFPIGSKTSWLFVPYWGLDSKSIDVTGYDKVAYFGITPDSSGIDTKEQGYLSLASFTKRIPKTTETYLTIRMTSSDLNTKVISDSSLQQIIATQAASLAKTNGFTGLILDFEQNALSFETVVKNITSLYTTVSTAAKANGLQFYVTIYGDAVYRGRPYDISTIAKTTNGILVMTYDFHKANGDPGPNFPLSGKETYGYDMSILINDFEKVVPRVKLTFVFGMFGYDWTVDEKGRTEKQATPVTLLDAQKKFGTPCILAKCVISRDKQAGETHATYIDAANQKHEVWYEDKESVSAKEQFFQSRGINSFGTWAYSYF